MNNDLGNIIYNLARASEDLNELYEDFSRNDPSYSNYGYQYYYRISNALDSINAHLSRLKYIDKPFIEGYLKKRNDDKFEVIYRDHNELQHKHVLSCGSNLELKFDSFDEENDESEWAIGHVEHRDGAYYFRGRDYPFLEDGMVVRIRKDY